MNSVRVRLFATARTSLGTDSVTVPLPRGDLTVADVLDELARGNPKFAAVVRASRIVRNGEYVQDRHQRLQGGDELAVHPPYSGG